MATVVEKLAAARQRQTVLRERRRTVKQKLASVNERIKRLSRKAKTADRRGVPSWIPDKFVDHWRKPWTAKARGSAAFRNLCWKHGYASPNFTEKETRCKRGDRVPAHLVANAQRQAFRLEQVRHELGDKPMPALSWYRPADYNRIIGGATNSRHIQADATDFDVATVNRIGRARFDAAFEKFYKNDGYGTYPSGSRHGDTRGTHARWTAF